MTGSENDARNVSPFPEAESALAALLEGNRRFAAGTLRHPHQAPGWRRALVAGQHPCAVIVGCSDSRVSPEILFDQGLGDLFVVRTAGHVVDRQALASIEYAAAHLGTPLILVLGHSSCGAIHAALDEEHVPPGNLPYLTAALRPAVEQARASAAAAAGAGPGVLGGVERRAADDPGLQDRAARMNARIVAAGMPEASPLLAQRIAAGRLRIVPAFYDLASGNVELVTA